jgi:predicted amidohydrolase
MIYVANWPAVRSFPWQQLLLARAIENQAYVVGVNRIGEDGNGIDHSGDSVVLNPIGNKLSKTKANKSSVETIVLSAKELTDFRKKFPVLMDADKI